MTEPEHWNYERVVHESDLSLEDPESLDDETLFAFSQLCEAPDLQPEGCLPCAAMVELSQRRGLDVEPVNEIEEYVHPILQEALGHPLDAEILTGEPVPVVERFAAQVHALDALVLELLEGPPVPPPDVSQEELALLVVAAQRWIALMEAQGLDLAPAQASVLHATRELVARLHRG